MLDDVIEAFTIKIYKNEDVLFEKKIKIVQKDNFFLANIKDQVKLSDSINVDLIPESIAGISELSNSKKVKIRRIQILIDNIIRGKTSVFETWIRNEIKNKVGDIAIEYFLENIYLDN